MFTIKKILNFILLSFYSKITREGPGEGIINFIDNFYYVLIGSLGSTILLIMFNILAGRMVGPYNYGTFILIQSIAMFLYLPMVLGINTSLVKFLSERDDFDDKSRIISSAYLLIFSSTLMSTLIYLFFMSEISKLISIPENLFTLSIIYAISFTFFVTTTNTLKGLRELKKYSILQFVSNVLILVLFVLLFWFKIETFDSLLISTFISYGLITAIIIIRNRSFLEISLIKGTMQALLRYGLLTHLGGASYIIYTNADKLFINKFMSFESIGIYNAYYYSSVNVAILFSGMVVTVLFPMVSRQKGQLKIIKLVNKFIPYVIALGIPMIFISQLIIVRLFGNMYHLDYLLMIVFAITAIIYFIYDVHAWILCSEGEKGVRIALSGSLCIAIAAIILDIFLIPAFGLIGAISSMCIAYLIGLTVINFNKNKLE